jgi:hypothetical protein
VGGFQGVSRWDTLGPMSLDPQVALEEFLSAVREHYAAAAHRTSDTDPRVEATYMALADAFEIYEDALYTAFDEVTPFELFDDVEDAKDNEDDEFEEFEDDDLEIVDSDDDESDDDSDDDSDEDDSDDDSDEDDSDDDSDEDDRDR